MILGIALMVLGVVCVIWGLNLFFGPSPKWCKGTDEDIEIIVGLSAISVIVGACLLIGGFILLLMNLPKTIG